MSDRCQGHCCRNIQIAIGPRELQENARANREGNRDRHGHDRNGWGPIIGVETLVEVLRWTGRRASFFKRTRHRQLTHDYIYMCRALLPNGDCAIYNRRPKMCRDYPDSRGCFEPLCEWSEQRRDKPANPVLQESNSRG